MSFAPISIRLKYTYYIVTVFFLKGMFCRGLMDGRGVFTRADGLKYEVGHNDDIITVLILNFIECNFQSASQYLMCG